MYALLGDYDLIGAYLLILSDNERFEVGYSLADALANYARSCIKKAYLYQQPWPKTAQYLRENDPIKFKDYRDTFYSYIYLAGRSGELAHLIFKNNENKKEELNIFLERNGDISSFFHYLENFGSGETGLSHEIEDNANYEIWHKLWEINKSEMILESSKVE